MTSTSKPALLVLEDGTLWSGIGFGKAGETTGEVVFNTSMTGYQEILTDPSYHGQIVVMTTPHIGNVGTNRDDNESSRIWVAGFAVREASSIVSNYRAECTLDEFMRGQNIVGISGVSTRALVKHIRTVGAMRAALSSVDPDPVRLLAVARSSRDMNGADLAREVSCTQTYQALDNYESQWYPTEVSSLSARSIVNDPVYIVAYDYGIKRNILRLLRHHGCRVTVVPATTSADAVLAMQPDGVFLSNGPGDPAACSYAIEATRQLLGKVPIFGICLGMQILGLALGGNTYKLKFGHRGGNQPVLFSDTGCVEITSHNHGFAVAAAGLPKDVEITHVDLNDGCVEGLRAKKYNAFGVQYHPEASPGPHDAGYLFDEYMKLVSAVRALKSKEHVLGS
jgi:carbamoyl-phosphate synthase small subunit